MTSIEAKGDVCGSVKLVGSETVQIPFSAEQVRKILNLVTQEARRLRNAGDIIDVMELEALCCNFTSAQWLLLGKGQASR